MTIDSEIDAKPYRPSARVATDSSTMSFAVICALLLALALPIHANADDLAGDQLLRRSYDSEVTGKSREYLVYLPQGYSAQQEKAWPVILFLHGNGQRGDGQDDLDFVMRFGPLMEAWVQRRELPFIIISPQLPLFGEQEAIDDRINHTRPARLEAGQPQRNHGYPSEWPIERQAEEQYPAGPHQAYDPFNDPDGLPKGWCRIDEELILILDAVLHEFHADSSRVYLSGISLGGFGSFHMAAKYPERWAAIAPIAGVGSLADAKNIAQAKIPVWMFAGGKDQVIKPHWIYKTARALEEGGLPVLRFTVHEDMDHDVWKRVYQGDELFDWFLHYSNQLRPSQEKSAN